MHKNRIYLAIGHSPWKDAVELWGISLNQNDHYLMTKELKPEVENSNLQAFFAFRENPGQYYKVDNLLKFSVSRPPVSEIVVTNQQNISIGAVTPKVSSIEKTLRI